MSIQQVCPVFPGSALNDGQWHSVELSSRRGRLTVAVDGKEEGGVAHASLSVAAGTQLFFGGKNWIYVDNRKKLLLQMFNLKLFVYINSSYLLYQTCINIEKLTFLLTVICLLFLLSCVCPYILFFPSSSSGSLTISLLSRIVVQECVLTYFNQPTRSDVYSLPVFLLWRHSSLILCFPYLPAQVVQLKTTVRSVKIPSTSFRAACASWASTTSRWTWLRCSKGCWETTASCRSTCAASLTGQKHQNPFHWSTTDPEFHPLPTALRLQGLDSSGIIRFSCRQFRR